MRRSAGAVPLATWTPAALTCHSAFLSRACRASAGQNDGSDGCHSSSSDQRRATAGAALSPAPLERLRALERQKIGAGQAADGQEHRRPARAAPAAAPRFAPAS